MKPVADLWYGVEAYDGNIIHIRETHIDQWAAGNIWLVCGSETDLLFDTGTGILPLAPLVDVLSNRQKIAVACCHYYDHAGALHEFESRACHRLEADAIANPSDDDEPLFEEELYAQPVPNFCASGYVQKGAIPTRVLEDGEVIDLGNRKIIVVHIPGRTPGSIALWEEATGFLFGGETAFVDPHDHDFPPDYSVDLYEESLKKLLELPVNRVFGGTTEFSISRNFLSL